MPYLELLLAGSSDLDDLIRKTLYMNKEESDES